MNQCIQINTLLNKFCIDERQIFYGSIKDCIDKEIKKSVITANPEIVMMAVKNEDLNKFFLDKDTIVIPDGIGVVNTLKRKYKNKKIKRNTGIDFVSFLLEYADESHLKICIYGSQERVLKDFKNKYEKKYPNIVFAEVLNGYDYSTEFAADAIIKTNSDIVLVALGSPRQELFINNMISSLKKGICVGVGGSLDVLSGHKKRAPIFFINLNIEWLYRIVSEPQRMKRFFKNNVPFMIKTLFL